MKVVSANDERGIKEIITVILPCYNEAHRLALSLPDLFSWREKFQESHNCTVKILLANDGCTDGTVELAKKLAHDQKDFDIVGYEKNQGRGAALKVAFSTASARSLFVLYMDADLATDLRHVHDVWLRYKEQRTKLMLCGNRYFAGNNLHRPFIRQLWSWGWKRFLSLLFWKRLPDTQCGFKALSYDIVPAVVGELQIKGFVADVEMVLRAWEAGAKVESLNIFWEEKKGSTIRWSTLLVMLKELRVLKQNLSSWLKKTREITNSSVNAA
jgi:glycosyltransferase involved in cell wall biosynthesis